MATVLSKICLIILVFVTGINGFIAFCNSDEMCEGGQFDKCVNCTSPCLLNCNNDDPLDPICNPICGLSVCECQFGYVRSTDGRCVLRSDC
ncbi:venom peptide BmKAPI [Microplitis demolitor]|uniref:venom peptide BmKAPI n=1 Tax=Microplitis demolitor TaxID=69319 RepID=UPI0006D4D9DF|nr:venom peptide BmKAPI [Microplitis demolitor]